MIPLAKLSPVPAAREAPSPNWTHRTGGIIRGVVLHATADQGHEHGAERWMQDPKSSVSAHLHVRRDGTVVRMVADRHCAWHAGRSAWTWPDGLRTDGLNDSTLGWEIANRNDEVERYTDAQYDAVARAAAHYVRQGLDLLRFVGHQQVSPGRKTDPGPCWDWIRFREAVEALLLPPPDVSVVQLHPSILGRYSPKEGAA
jgi:N-acetyl-anhydromuramyl-L-alanine amidase AmpD